MSAPGLVVVDKPPGITSHDVVARCRRAFGTRKVGHAGTLDPMATGVLIVGIDRATKILGLLTAVDKAYDATIRLGSSTNTDDAQGEVLARSAVDGVGDDAIAAAVAALRGDIAQVPSTVSAIKVGGRRAYALARAGEVPELAARPVRVDRFDVLAIRRTDPTSIDVDVTVACSSGTYVRALARDVGVELAVGGHLTALRRTRVGRFGLDRAVVLDALAERPVLSLTLDEACLAEFPRRDLTDAEAESVGHGRPLAPAGVLGTYAATAPDGRVMALLRDGERATNSVVVLRPATL